MSWGGSIWRCSGSQLAQLTDGTRQAELPSLLELKSFDVNELPPGPSALRSTCWSAVELKLGFPVQHVEWTDWVTWEMRWVYGEAELVVGRHGFDRDSRFVASS